MSPIRRQQDAGARKFGASRRASLAREEKPYYQNGPLAQLGAASFNFTTTFEKSQQYWTNSILVTTNAQYHVCLNYAYLFTTCPIYSTYLISQDLTNPIFCFCVLFYLLIKFHGASTIFFHSSSQAAAAKCGGRKFCLSSVSSKFLHHRDNWPSELCIIAFQICLCINAYQHD